jgi:hypothetical protein
MDIKFYKENFYLKELTFGETIMISREIKKSLRYQLLFVIGKGNDYKVYSLFGIREVTGIDTRFNCAYVISRSNEVCEESQNYEANEINIIKCIISYFADIKPEITEKLCAAIGDNILKEYHRSYGKEMIDGFKKDLFTLPEVFTVEKSKLNYGRPRYSIINLLNDFSKTKDLQIYTDPELIGKYKRISRKIKDGSTTMMDRWAKFVKVVGNRTRANLSIRVLSKVKVTVPENTLGVRSGERELISLRNFTLIVDGLLNMTEIGIKTNDTKLIGKLKRLGILEPMLLEDEYVVNLSGIPVFSKTPSISSNQLGIAEYRIRECDIRIKYLELLIYKLEKSLSKLRLRKITEPEKDEATLFLESLGIFGDKYFSKRSEVDGIATKIYTTTEIIGKVEGIPAELYPNVRSFVDTGSCKNVAINKVLSGVSYLRDVKDLGVLKDRLNLELKNRELSIEHLRNLKFRIITGKTLMFSGHHSPKVEDTRVNITKDVSVTWIIKETDIEI